MRLAFLLLLLAAAPASAQTGTIAGQVTEADGVTAIIGASVRVDSTTLRAATDIDGNYRIIGVPVGSYTVTVSYSGYPTQKIQGVDINAGETRQLSFTLSDGEIVGCPTYSFDPPLLTNDAIGQSRILMWWDLENMPVNR